MARSTPCQSGSHPNKHPPRSARTPYRPAVPARRNRRPFGMRHRSIAPRARHRRRSPPSCAGRGNSCCRRCCTQSGCCRLRTEDRSRLIAGSSAVGNAVADVWLELACRYGALADARAAERAVAPHGWPTSIQPYWLKTSAACGCGGGCRLCFLRFCFASALSSQRKTPRPNPAPARARSTPGGRVCSSRFASYHQIAAIPQCAPWLARVISRRAMFLLKTIDSAPAGLPLRAGLALSCAS